MEPNYHEPHPFEKIKELESQVEYLQSQITELQLEVSVLKEKKQRFKKPTIKDVCDQFRELQGHIDGTLDFFNHYESNGWKVGRVPMKDWKAAARNWISRAKEKDSPEPTSVDREHTKRGGLKI